MPAGPTRAAAVGPLLRDWRLRRRRSQLDLSIEAGISARHLSFLETGRSRPSPDMVERLAEQLEVPLRERNALLLAAGFAPRHPERPLDDAAMGPVREALETILRGHEPYPAVVVDRHWNMVASNASINVLIDGVAPELLIPPVNVYRVGLHPRGLAPKIVNLGEWRSHLLHRLARQVALTGDPVLNQLLEECRQYPDPPDAQQTEVTVSDRAIALPVRIRSGTSELSFLSTITTFGTAIEITASELSIESFFPADAATADRLRALPVT